MKQILKTTMTIAFFLIWAVPGGGETLKELPDADISGILARIETQAALPDLLAYATNPSVTAFRQSFIENYRIGTSYPDPRS